MKLSLATKLKLIYTIVHWRLTWEKRNTSYLQPGIDNPKFVTALDAVRLIEDGSCTVSSGMAGNTRCSIFYWAIKELFLETGHPRDLTWISVGAQGGRGKAPGTLEEMSIDGLVTRFIAGHHETVKAMLKLADEGKVELHTLPQGQMTFLFEAQARGEDHVLSDTAIGTFLDPRVDRGSTVVPGVGESLISVEGDKLRFSLPTINNAVFTAPWADSEGNLYIKGASMITESYESSMAARKNGGKVIVAVADIVPKDESKIWMRAEDIDAIVVNPRNEQTGAVAQRKYWEMFTEGGQGDVEDAVNQLKWVNNTMKITPYRDEAANALARLAASQFTRVARKGAYVNIGVGLPEEVCRVIYNGGLTKDVTFLTETGVMGGMPAPGIFFGAGVYPEKIISSAQIFHFCYENLDVTILGLLEADSDGNINVSNRGDKPSDYIGPGGLPDLTRAAKTIIFVGTWMAHSEMAIKDGKLQITKPGTPKFIEKVREITFSGQTALSLGKIVYYVTNVGIFHLTERGMLLTEVMPGIDIQKDILDVSPMKIILPEDGNIPIVDRSIVTGEGYQLSWQNK
jgi:propionate CoA-transferase